MAHKLIEHIMRDKGLTGYALAARLGMTVPGVYRLLRASGLPRDPAAIYRLYEISGMTAEDFLGFFKGEQEDGRKA